MESRFLNLQEIKPEDFFVSDFINKYEELHKSFYDRLTQLNTTIIIIKKIEKFPFQYFVGPQEMAFWDMIYWNFYHMAIIIIYGFVEKKSNTKNLNIFMKKMLQNIKQVYKQPYEKKLKDVKFYLEVENIKSKVEDIRNKIVAHIAFENVNYIKGLSISELDDFFNRLKKLFEAFTFGTTYHETRLMDFMPTTIGGKPTQTHLDDIFDLIVKDSGFLNEPEKVGAAWKAIRKDKSEEELEIFNYYRKKHGMPEA